jgi:hypothetical protein
VASPARSRTTDSLGGDLGPAAIKGGILVFVALVIGTVLLLQGTGTDVQIASPDNGEEGTEDGDGTPGTTEPSDEGPDGTTPTTSGNTTTTAAEARAPEEVTVLVANGSGIPGAAGELGATLSALGYLIAEPDNTPTPASSSSVYFIPGFEPEARAVAVALGLDPDAEGVVGEVPEPVPTIDASMGAANVLVILGPDVAPTTSGGTTGGSDTTLPPDAVE